MRNILIFVSLLWMNLSHAQVLKPHYELNEPTTGNKVFVATDYISFLPGFHFKATDNVSLHAYIDDSGNEASELGYQAYLNPLTRVLDKNKKVGYIPSVFDVSSSGAANYSVPIVVPPGINGIEPSLNVVYNSSGSSGLLGMKWDLVGLQQISRAAPSLRFGEKMNGLLFTKDDNFSLNGNRLILHEINGNSRVYYTYLEGFQKITANVVGEDGPTSFLVETKEGIKLEFGQTNDAKVLLDLSDNNSPIINWKINKITDVNGNYLTYHYGVIENQHVLKEIKYTGNEQVEPFAAVKLFYSKKNDVSENKYYFGNNHLKGHVYDNLLLQKIQVNHQGEHVRSYRFRYNQFVGVFNKFPRLNEITLEGKKECSVNSTVIGWGTEDFQAVDIPVVDENDDVINFTQDNVRLTDFNGDGLTDILKPIYVGGTSGDIEYELYQNTNNGQFSKISTTDIDVGKYVKTFLSYAFSFTTGVQVTSDNLVYNRTAQGLLDFNNDLKTDMLIIDEGSSNFTIKKYNSTGVNYEFNETISGPLFNDEKVRVIQGDFDGNGKVDIISVTPSFSHIRFSGDQQSKAISHENISIHNNEDPKIIVPIRFNSNGKTDLLVMNYEGLSVWEWDANSDGFVLLKNNSSINNHSSSVYLSDFDGDGLTDIEVYKEQNSQNPGFPYHVEISSKHYHSTGLDYIPRSNKTDYIEWANYIPSIHAYIDVNQDGIPERVVATEDGIMKFYKKEFYDFGNYGYNTHVNGYDYMITIPNIDGIDLGLIQFGEFNGDGTLDLFYPATGTSDDAVIINLNGTVDESKYVKNITDGFNNNMEIIYTNSQDISVYNSQKTSGSPAYTTLIEGVYLPTKLVKEQITSNNDNSVVRSATYTYANAVFDPMGGGFIGFNLMTNRVLGITNKRVQYFDEQTLLSNYSNIETVGISRKISLAENLYEGIYTNRILNLTTRTQETDLFTKAVAGTDYVYDDYGNLLNAKTTFTDGSTTEINTNAYVKTKGWLPSDPDIVTTINKIETASPFITIINNDFDNHGNLEKIETINPVTQLVELTTNYKYHPIFGNKIEETTTADNLPTQTSTWEYDNTGRFVTKEMNTLGYSKEYTYDGAYGIPLTTTNLIGLKTTNTYNGFGSLVKTTLPNEKSIVYTTQWEDNGPGGTLYATMIDGDGSPYSKKYIDALERTIRTETIAFGNQVFHQDFAYNSKGKISYKTNVYPASGENKLYSTHLYDAYGRKKGGKRMMYLSSQEDYIYYEDNVAIFYSYHGEDKEELTLSTYNDLGLLKKKEEPRSYDDPDIPETINYTYHSSGNVEIVNAEGSATVVEYDEFGRKIGFDDPNMPKITYNYNAYGQMTLQVDGKGNSYSMSYDMLGRMTSKLNTNDASDVTSYTYHEEGGGLGQIKSMSAGNGSITSYEYNDLGQLASKTETTDDNTSFTSTYTYDVYGNLETHQYPSGYTLLYIYDNLGTLVEILGGKESEIKQRIWALNAINNKGQISAYEYGNGLQMSYDFDDYGLPIQFKTNNSNVFNMEFEFEPYRGNLLSRTHTLENGTTNTERFEYDYRDRLEVIYNNGNEVLRMQYENNGNIAQKTDVGNYSYDSNVPHAVASISPIHDSITSHNWQNIAYTSFDKTENINEGEHDLTYYYGPNEQRIRGVHKILDAQGNLQVNRITYYASQYEEIHQQNNIEKLHYITTPSGLAAIYKEDQFGNDSLFYVHQDYQGSIMAITDEGGALVQNLSYDAWGRRRNPSNWSDYDLAGNNIPLFDRGYTGHEHLNMFGLINMNGRMYDPLLGQMLSPDNYVQNPTNNQNYNRYAYVLNNPLKYTDPSGESVVGFVIAGVIIGAYIGGMYANEGKMNPAKWADNKDTWKGIIIGGIIGGAVGYLIGTMWQAGAPIFTGFNIGGQQIMVIGFSSGGFVTANTVAGLIGIGGATVAGGTFIDWSNVRRGDEKKYRGFGEAEDVGSQSPTITAPDFGEAAADAWAEQFNDPFNDNLLGIYLSEVSIIKDINGSYNNQYASVVEGLSGKPYSWGEEGPDSFDCSGTVCYGIQQISSDFGRPTADGLYNNHTIPATNNGRGTLVFYDYTSDGIMDHVTTILNSNQMLHPSQGAGVLQIQPLNYLDGYTNKRGGSIYFRQINWKSILN